MQWGGFSDLGDREIANEEALATASEGCVPVLSKGVYFTRQDQYQDGDGVPRKSINKGT